MSTRPYTAGFSEERTPALISDPTGLMQSLGPYSLAGSACIEDWLLGANVLPGKTVIGQMMWELGFAGVMPVSTVIAEATQNVRRVCRTTIPLGNIGEGGSLMPNGGVPYGVITSGEFCASKVRIDSSTTLTGFEFFTGWMEGPPFLRIPTGAGTRACIGVVAWPAISPFWQYIVCDGLGTEILIPSTKTITLDKWELFVWRTHLDPTPAFALTDARIPSRVTFYDFDNLTDPIFSTANPVFKLRQPRGSANAGSENTSIIAATVNQSVPGTPIPTGTLMAPTPGLLITTDGLLKEFSSDFFCSTQVTTRF